MTRDYIWFKTRVGFASVTEPSEILAWKFPQKPVWCIYARIKTGPEMTMKNILGGRGSVTSPWLYLACFSDGPGVSKAIAECMARIEDSIRTKTEFCDLSRFGDPQAWGESSEQIQWPNDSQDA
jgi:hypothetical protein